MKYNNFFIWLSIVLTAALTYAFFENYYTWLAGFYIGALTVLWLEERSTRQKYQKRIQKCIVK